MPHPCVAGDFRRISIHTFDTGAACKPVLHSLEDDSSFATTSNFFTGIATLARKPSLSRHLRDTRIARGLSVAEVAERAGVSVASVYLWETGKTQPREANLTALCKALRLPIRATRELAAG